MVEITATAIEEHLPAVSDDDLKRGFPTAAPMAPGLAVFFNDALYTRCAKLATVMSRADGVIPKHLLGKPEACFAVLSRAITWNLDPFAVAMSTYQTPGGAIGYEGKLVQAILENSGKVQGQITFTHEGDWSKVKGKFKLQASQRGGQYPVPTWTREDAAGLCVVVAAKLKDETQPRTLRIDLDSCFPLNSPLWATAPERQICYLAVRAFGNIAMPGILMGIPFDVDPTGFYGEPMTDVTPPRPTRTSEFERKEPNPPTAPAKPNGGHEPVVAPGMPPTDKARYAPPEEGSAPVTDAAWAAAGFGPGGTPLPAQSPEPIEETALDRGIRLLALCKSITDVGDLRETITQELPEAEQMPWSLKCGARSREITDAISKAGKAKGK